MRDAAARHNARGIATHRRIIDAAAALLAEGSAATISIPAIARRAGVSLATTYRHFPTKEALLDAVALLGDEESRDWLGDRPITIEILAAFFGRRWPELARNGDLMRAQHMTPFGREVRRHRLALRSQEVATGLRLAGIDPDTPVGRRLFALVAVLTSSASLLEFTDLLGIDPETAAAYMAWAVRVLRDASLPEQQAGSAAGAGASPSANGSSGSTAPSNDGSRMHTSEGRKPGARGQHEESRG